MRCAAILEQQRMRGGADQEDDESEINAATQRMLEEKIDRLAEQSRVDQKRWREADAALKERIDALVSAIGEMSKHLPK